MTTAHLAEPGLLPPRGSGAPAPARFGTANHDPVSDLWGRLQRPFDPVAAVAAATGLSLSVVTHLVGAAIAASPEAERLLDDLPHTIRALAISVASQIVLYNG